MAPSKLAAGLKSDFKSESIGQASCVVKQRQRTGFEDAWVGIEPTFQNRSTVEKWARMAADEAGEEKYFKDPGMLKLEKRLAKAVIKKYRSRLKDKSVIEPEKAPPFNAPLELGMLTSEARWENRAQMCKTTARDFVEAMLHDVHFLVHLSHHRKVAFRPSILQDQLLSCAEETLEKHKGKRVLDRMHRKAYEKNLEDSGGRVKSDWIEPETLFWAAWKILPGRAQFPIAHEAVEGFVERVHQAAAHDPRPRFRKDPMEWHRHRVHPILWDVLTKHRRQLKPSDPVRQELEFFLAHRDAYLLRRPIASPTAIRPPWC